MVHAVGDVVYFFGLNGGGYQGKIVTINADRTMNVIAFGTAVEHRVVEQNKTGKLVEVEQPQVDDPDTTPADAQDAEEAAADAEGPSDA